MTVFLDKWFIKIQLSFVYLLIQNCSVQLQTQEQQQQQHQQLTILTYLLHGAESFLRS
jgi:hypothetical protein